MEQVYQRRGYSSSQLCVYRNYKNTQLYIRTRRKEEIEQAVPIFLLDLERSRSFKSEEEGVGRFIRPSAVDVKHKES